MIASVTVLNSSRPNFAGALIPILLSAIRAITLQRCRIVVRGILGQYQYYCMLCLVTNIVGSNLKSKNQEVSGFSDQWVLNAKVDFNEIYQKCLPTLLFERPKFWKRYLKKSKCENFTLKKGGITFAQGCNVTGALWSRNQWLQWLNHRINSQQRVIYINTLTIFSYANRSQIIEVYYVFVKWHLWNCISIISVTQLL